MDDDTAQEHKIARPMVSVLLPSRDRKSNTPLQQVKWVGMTPLEWIESLSAKAKAEEAMQMKKIFPSMTFNPSTPLASPLSQVEKPTPPSQSLLLVGGGGNRSRTFLETVEDVVASPLSPSFLSTSSRPAGSFPSHQMPMYWDFSLLEQSQPVERMRQLVLIVESGPSFLKLRLPFERTRDHFFYSVGYIRTHDTDPRCQLDNLYRETMHKLEALIGLANKLKLEEEASMKKKPGHDQPVVAMTPYALLPCSPMIGRYQDLGLYMTYWLKENWINPYPDETVLQKIAQDCGMTTAVVSNWLINARTRKWRPAILKAFEMNRPAGLLLEDSINLFNGKPLRGLGGGNEIPQPSPWKRSRHG